jgi:hypothetical protein
VRGDVVAIGPLMWALLAVGILSWLLALFVTVDGLRRVLTHKGGPPETVWPYVAVCGAYVVAYAAFQLEQITKYAPWLGTVVLVGLPIVFGIGVAYLLRVVFPKPAAPAPAPSPDETPDPELSEERPE